MAKTKTYILLFLILAFGLFLRIYNIDNAPPGVYPDEAVNGIDAMTAIESGNYQWFYEANNGREGLFMNLIALCFQLLGVSVLSLKLPSIIFGTLTILGTYLLAREIFLVYLSESRSAKLALISAFSVATSFWAINFSRISFRANMLPFVLVFSFYFLWKGLRTKKNWDFVWGGLFFGLGLHTYIAFRIAPLILLATLFVLLFNRKGFFGEYWKKILIFILFTALAAAPMIYTFYLHPEYVQSRTGNVSILNPEINQGRPILTFLKSFGLSLAKYNFWGDQNWRHNYPPYALLDPITGIMFMFGLIYVTLRLIHLVWARLLKKITDPRLEIYAFLLVWLLIMLVPEFMTGEGNPHALRSIGTLPVIFLFSGLAYNYFLNSAKKHTEMYRKLVYFFLVAMILGIGVFNSLKYHYFWANKAETAQAFEANLMDASNYLSTLPKSQEKFVIAEVMQRIPIELFHWREPDVHYFYPGEIDQISPRSENFSIIMTDRNDETIENLKERFPKLELKEKTDKFGLSFYTLNPNY